MSNVGDINSALCVVLKNLASPLPSLLCCLMPRTKRKLLFTSHSFKLPKLQENTKPHFLRSYHDLLFFIVPALSLWLHVDVVSLFFYLSKG